MMITSSVINDGSSNTKYHQNLSNVRALALGRIYTRGKSWKWASWRSQRARERSHVAHEIQLDSLGRIGTSKARMKEMNVLCPWWKLKTSFSENMQPRIVVKMLFSGVEKTVSQDILGCIRSSSQNRKAYYTGSNPFTNVWSHTLLVWCRLYDAFHKGINQNLEKGKALWNLSRLTLSPITGKWTL